MMQVASCSQRLGRLAALPLRACGGRRPCAAGVRRRTCAAAAAAEPPCPANQDPIEWPGLKAWRAAAVDARRSWGERGPSAAAPPAGDAAAAALPLAPTLVEAALQVLQTADPATKAGLAHRAWASYRSGALPLGAAGRRAPLPAPSRPARPARPALVAPKQVPAPKDSPLPLPAHMLHNLAHIELNAIDLAMDTVARFAHLALPAAFYEDFARVADDESRHFCWTLQRLRELGADYGDMVAHDLLWEGAQLSAGDLNARLAIVPMSQEARGLDAGGRLAQRLTSAGDARTAAVVARIALEEKAHVAIGVGWFKRVCAATGAPPPPSFRALLAALSPELLKGPFNHEARAEVGLPREWYDPAAWPPAAAAALVPPAQAAAAKGRGAPAGGAGGGGGPGAAAGVGGLGGAGLEELRRRLELMLETEAAAADM
ncbi:MAG: hypothetical protein J3K34DRAFT_387568 [Monoraphidium minutum]|nr:MAG: hypothetical protein J3K34DRAFT_387568 [Monoraphidium minutum]